MTPRENLLRAARFQTPETIPMVFRINGSCWQNYSQDALQDLMLEHHLLFPGYCKVPRVVPRFSGNTSAAAPYTDEWGCTWQTAENGITGAVVRHPLDTWDAWNEYRPPSADSIDWTNVDASFARKRNAGQLCSGGLVHGHTFLRLCDIRGYENVLMDMLDDEPRLWQLLEMIEAYNASIVCRYIDRGAEWMGYPEDLGMQVGPMLSPELFRKYIKPIYQRLMAPARQAGAVVHMHSDGDLHQLAEDLIDGGVTVLNLQDRVNGLEWIRDRFRGRVCIDLDIDRQDVTRFGTPEQIDRLIRDEVEMLGSRNGGLMMIYGLYPGVPLCNVKAVMDAMERYASFYA